MASSTLLYFSFLSSPNPNRNALRFSHSSIFDPSRLIFSRFPKLVAVRVKKRAPLNCFAAQQPHNEGTPSKVWESWVLHGAISPERILRLIAGATSSPICQFIESPRTFLHSVDPRIKLIWLLALVILPARSNIYIRFGLVGYLSILSISVLPTQIWMDQLGRVALLSGILFVMLGFGTDSVPPLLQSRTPPPSLIGLPDIPASLSGYSYLIMKLGPLQLTRKGLSLASTSACLSFTIFQSASLCLTSTTPEQLASALQWFMVPFTVLGVPVAEIILTLLLSLRFINLVFDEVRNAALGIVARRINWKQLTLMESLDVFFMYIQRIFKNIFSHAEQISKAMIARGFRGGSDKHKIYFFHESSNGFVNILSLFCLFGLICAAVLLEHTFI
ncbi:putative ABC/ECF transporter, transmembrane component [Dioscorea sansibarensis]